jgi:hypothetical protein
MLPLADFHLTQHPGTTRVLTHNDWLAIFAIDKCNSHPASVAAILYIRFYDNECCIQIYRAYGHFISNLSGSEGGLG